VDIIAKRNAKERVNRAEMTSLIHKNVAIRATAELKYLRSVVGANAALPPKLKAPKVWHPGHCRGLCQAQRVQWRQTLEFHVSARFSTH